MSESRDQRAAARRLLERMRDDRALARRLREDPEGVLAEAGLPPEGVDDIVREAPPEAGAGARACSFTCLWTCALTGP